MTDQSILDILQAQSKVLETMAATLVEIKNHQLQTPAAFHPTFKIGAIVKIVRAEPYNINRQSLTLSGNPNFDFFDVTKDKPFLIWGFSGESFRLVLLDRETVTKYKIYNTQVSSREIELFRDELTEVQMKELESALVRVKEMRGE